MLETNNHLKSNNFDWNLNENTATKKILNSLSNKYNHLFAGYNIERTINYSFKFSRFLIKLYYKNLNKIHKKKLNYKTYEFLLLPWCFESVSHSSLIWQLSEKFQNKKIKINKVDISDILSTPENFKCSSSLTNYWLLSQILDYRKIKYQKLKQIHSEPTRKINNNSYKLFIKRSLNNLRFLFNPRLIIWDTGLTFFQEMILNLKLGQVPITMDSSYMKLNKYDIQFRQKLLNLNTFTKKKKFENFFIKIFPFILPIEFLESFDSFYNYSKDIQNSNKYLKRKILTQNIHINSRRAILSKYIQHKSKLYILQHGGGYGTGKKSPGELLEKHLADKFFSWGWKDSNKKVVQFINIEASQNRFLSDYNNDKIVLFFYTETKFFNKIGFWPMVNFQRISKNRKIKKLIDCFDKKLKKKLILRYNSRGFRRSGISINKNFFGKFLHYDNGSKNWRNSISKKNITIHENINGTSWLDTISQDVPTLILDNSKIYKTRENFKKYYRQLKKNKIIFTDPSKLANFINKNFNNIDKWWTSKKVTRLKKEIVKNYTNIQTNPAEKLKKILQN